MRRKLDIFGKKSGGTLNPQVKIVGGTPNPDQIFVSAAACAVRAKTGLRRASGGRQENLIRVRSSPHYFDLRVRGTPTCFTENVEFSSRLAPPPDTPPSKIGNFKKSEKKSKLASLLW